MASIVEADDREALLARFRKLTPEHQAEWGSLTAEKMVCHLSDQLRSALGDLESRERGNFLTHTLMKWLVIHLPLPVPKGKIKTVPEMLSTAPTGWEADTRELEELVARLAEAKAVAPHPVFGELSHSEWCILAAKHIDHHLRQFRL